MRPRRDVIAQAQTDVVATLPNADPINLLAACWACGLECTTLQRAHIVARANAGADDPDNFLLLCWWCHREQPDGLPRAEQIRWARERPHWIILFINRWGDVIEALHAELATVPGAAERLRNAPWQQWVQELAQASAASRLATVEANVRHGLIAKARAWIGL